MITLDCFCLVAVGVAVPTVDSVFREPRSIIKSHRLDDEGISFPPSYRVSEPPRIDFIRVWQITTVGPNRPKRVAPFEELHHPVRQLNKFETIVVGEPSGPAERITDKHGIFRIRYRFSVESNFGFSGLVPCFTPLRHRWGLPAELNPIL